MITNTVLILAAGVFGFFLGRFSVNRLSGEENLEENEGAGEAEQRRKVRGSGKTEKFAVGSPVSGEVVWSDEGEHPVVVIRPEQGKLFAPVSGKVTRLFPTGNALLFTTEFGAEMHISVGEVADDLLERYYRPRVIQNEVVPKGKLLLEFDVAGLASEGQKAEVSMRMENCDCTADFEWTREGAVKAGEDILRIF